MTEKLIAVTCSRCSKRLGIKPRLAGKTLKCTGCDSQIKTPYPGKDWLRKKCGDCGTEHDLNHEDVCETCHAAASEQLVICRKHLKTVSDHVCPSCLQEFAEQNPQPLLLPPLRPGKSTQVPALPGRADLQPCPYCGKSVKKDARRCPHCTFPVATAGPESRTAESPADLIHPTSPPLEPLLVAILSGCCIAGLGQMVLGQVAKGVLFLLAALTLGIITAGFSVFLTWPLMGIDAFMVAKKLKSGKPVTQWECFPS